MNFEWSWFPNQCNVAKGIYNFGDLYKYRHVRQAKVGTGASLGTHPTLETNMNFEKSWLVCASLNEQS